MGLGAMLTRAVRARAQRKRGGKKLLIGMALVVAYFALVVPAMIYMRPAEEVDEYGELVMREHNPLAAARRLSGGAACTGDEGSVGHAVLFFLVILYMFLGLAIVCDDFFVPSLEALSEKLSLSEDVAGATFMAAGSSAPELFTSVADAFGPRNSMGIGTIVGSAMFNILVIVAMAAAATKQTLHIDWRPLMRDATFYGISLALMSIMILTGNGAVEWWEGLLMVAGYVCYVLFMTINARVFDWCARVQGRYQVAPKPSTTQLASIKDSLHVDDEGTAVPNPAAATGATPGDGSEPVVPIKPADLEAGAEAKEAAAEKAKEGAEAAGAAKEEEEEEEDESRFAWPDTCSERILFIFAFPYLVLMTYTIPDCSKPRWEKWYLVSFGMSILWIGGLCWIMVVMASLVGCILDIDPPVMGIVVLAVGTSIPDALGSMIVARQGEADMAIANAVGSNVFDILLGLGLPWFMSSLMHGDSNQVNVDGISVGLVILFCTIFLFIGVIAVNKFRMNSTLGYVFFVAYILYLTYTLLAEYCVPGIPTAGNRCD